MRNRATERSLYKENTETQMDLRQSSADRKSELGQTLLPLDHSEHPSAAIYPNPPVYQGQQQYGAPAVSYVYGPHSGYNVVSVQPAVTMTNTPLANPLPEYVGYSIFTMLCCCLPLGVAALVYSITTRDANIFGHQQLAEKNSRMARILNHVSVGIGLIFIVLIVIYFIFLGTTYARFKNT